MFPGKFSEPLSSAKTAPPQTKADIKRNKKAEREFIFKDSLPAAAAKFKGAYSIN